MTKEDPTSSNLSSLVGGTGKPYAPFGAPRPPRSNVMTANKAHPQTCDSQSLFTDGGTGKPYAPLGAPRHPHTCNSSDSYGHAGNKTHAAEQRSPPVSPPWFEARPPQPLPSGTNSTQDSSGNLTQGTLNGDAHPSKAPPPATNHQKAPQ